MGFIAAALQRQKLRAQAIINVLYLLGRPASAWDVAPYVGRRVDQVGGYLVALETKGYLDSEWREPARPDGKPRRRYYFLTEKGRLARTATAGGSRGSSCWNRPDHEEGN